LWAASEALTDDELAIVMNCARPLAPQDRAQFLRAVAVELAKYPELGPGIVGRVVAKTQKQFFDPPLMPRFNNNS
jgi:hypothetical protein